MGPEGEREGLAHWVVEINGKYSIQSETAADNRNDLAEKDVNAALTYLFHKHSGAE